MWWMPLSISPATIRARLYASNWPWLQSPEVTGEKQEQVNHRKKPTAWAGCCWPKMMWFNTLFKTYFSPKCLIFFWGSLFPHSYLTIVNISCTQKGINGMLQVNLTDFLWAHSCPFCLQIVVIRRRGALLIKGCPPTSGKWNAPWRTMVLFEMYIVQIDCVNKWTFMKKLLISAAEGRVMKFQLQRVSITAWMRTQRGGITTWTSLG